jgi:hypothetical protein
MTLSTRDIYLEHIRTKLAYNDTLVINNMGFRVYKLGTQIFLTFSITERKR